MKGVNAAVSAVVVSYNVAGLLGDCLDSLEAARDAGQLSEIIVVDSSSSDGSAGMVRECFGDASLYVVPNRGYGAAANIGLARASGDAVFILNADTIVGDGAVETLARSLFAVENLGMVGPRLLYPDGRPQPSRRRFPTPWTPVFESTVFEDWFPGNRWVTRYRMLDQPGSGAPCGESVDWLVGAALMVKRAAFEQAGGFDESFRLYAEELEWCYRIRQHGWDIRYIPEAAVIHHEGASTSQERLSSRLEFDRGRVRAQRVIHGPRVAWRTTKLIKLNYAIQLFREGLKWSLGHRRDLRLRRIRNYWTLLRSDLDG